MSSPGQTSPQSVYWIILSGTTSRRTGRGKCIGYSEQDVSSAYGSCRDNQVSRPAGEFFQEAVREGLGREIIYADPVDLTEMINMMKTGTKEMPEVGQILKWFYPE